MQAGDVILLNFPFSDLSGSKLRPAVVLATLERDDLIACQITSARDDPRAVELAEGAFSAGDLKVKSYARPGKLFTANLRIVNRHVARVQENVLAAIRQEVIQLLERGY